MWTDKNKAHRWMALLLWPVLLMAFPAQGGTLSLLINGKAIHINPPPGSDFNEKNWGAGLQYDFGHHTRRWFPFVTTAGYQDSLRNPSYYTGAGVMHHLASTSSNLQFDIGLVGFLMVREDYNDKRPFPGILPVASFGTRKVAINLTYIPDVKPKMVPLWFFQLKLSLPSDH